MNAPPILTSSRAAVMILTAAQAGEVPLPDQIEHMVLGDREPEAQLVFFVKTLDDLSAWSTWLEESINVADRLQPSGKVHASVDGSLFDQRIRVVCLFVPASEAVPV